MSKAAALPVHRTPYDGLQASVSHDSGLHCEDPSLAIQEAKDSCNLNAVMAKYTRTGELSHFHNLNPMFGDFSNLPTDLQSSLNTIISAQRSFDSLPATVRKRFDNSPVDFYKFCLDDKNLPELRSLGLLSPEAEARFQKSAVAEGEGGEPPSKPSSSKKPLSGASKAKPSSEDAD